MKEKPFLLLSNDDGFAAKGIQELIKVLRPMADLMVVAPSGPRSGASGSITSEYPLRCKDRVGTRVFIVQLYGYSCGLCEIGLARLSTPYA